MKRLLSFIALAGPISILLTAGCKDSSLDTSLFTIEVIDDVRVVHNHAPQYGNSSMVALERIGTIGELESQDERYILYDPADAVRLSNGDICMLEAGGCTVKRYNQDHEYVSSFGQKGQGPGDFQYPFCMRLSENRLFIADSKISFFSLGGNFLGGFKPKAITGLGSISAQYRRSCMAVLSGLRVVLPSHPSQWMESGGSGLLSVYDEKGAIIRSFGAAKQYDDPKLTLKANIVHFAADSHDNIYIAYAHQNRIGKYSQNGKLIFSADRTLPYEVKNVMKVEVFKSGDMETEIPWPSVSSVAKGIGIDQKDRIWVLTFLKQPNRFLTFDDEEDLTECYVFDVFDSDGLLLFRVPFPNIRFDNISLCGDRLFLIDAQHEACVHEYRIVDMN